MRPVVLIVCDGWGSRSETFGNAIAQAPTPVMDSLLQRWPNTVVAASGEAVGLPPGQQGNSEVGHLTIGAGRIIRQPLSRISHAIDDGTFFSNDVLIQAIGTARERGGALHCLGLVSPGGVHSHQRHGVALAELAKRQGFANVVFHAFTDGRDEPPSSAADFVAEFEADLRKIGVGRVVSVSGRYYAMDRDQHWERIEPAFRAVTGGGNRTELPAVDYIKQQYGAGNTDEFIIPTSLAGHPGLNDGDTIVFWNFRPDRARQMTHAFTDPGFKTFDRPSMPKEIPFVTFTEYERGLPVAIAFPKPDVRETLAEVVAGHKLRQFHVAETEKYAHVTYFINGGNEQPLAMEERKLIPSPRIATYDLQPEMSAEAITDEAVGHINAGEDALIILNFANADMVGHTGKFAATERAVSCVDSCIGKICEAALARDWAVLITADHGNAEDKINPDDNSPLTAHTTSPVPVILCGVEARSLRAGGGLSDVAPTVLDIIGLETPPEMTGRSLLRG